MVAAPDVRIRNVLAAFCKDRELVLVEPQNPNRPARFPSSMGKHKKNVYEDGRLGLELGFIQTHVSPKPTLELEVH